MAASKWTKIPSAIAGTTVYTDGTLVLRNASVTLPEVNHVTAEVNANGPFEVPITGQLESLELAITITGIPEDSLSLLARQESQHIEVRAAQDMVTIEGQKLNVGIKAFMTAVPKGIPGIAVEPGEPGDNEMTFSVFRYQLFVANKEQFLYDRLNGILKVNGKDYGQSIESLL